MSGEAESAGTWMNGGTAEDHLAIEQLIYRYALAFDGGDGDAFGECFAPNAVLWGPGVKWQGDFPGALGKVYRARSQDGSTEYSRHEMLNRSYTVQEGRATGITYCIATVVSNKGGERTLTHFHIRYHDELVKHGGRWRFLKREFEVVCVTTGGTVRNIAGDRSGGTL